MNHNSTELEQVRDERVEGEEEEELSESAMRIQPWTKQITLRGLIASTIIGCIYSVIQMKMNLTTGINPNLNVSAALLAYVFIQAWTKILKKFGFVSVPFTRQENTMIQTCSVACYSIALGGGLGSYLLGMDKRTYELAGVGTVGNTANSYKKLEIGWMTGYLLVVCFVGLFVLVPLRKVLIVDYKLTFPTGMATAVLINGFHGKNDKKARKQVKGFLKFFSYSFSWAFFQWFYTGKQDCGFQQFPTFGLKAWKQTFYFDFSLTYVGTGMICPHIVNISLLLGAILSWGVMWPLIAKLKGEWFPADVPESSMKSLNGYKVFISIALLLGDGLYNFAKILYFTLSSVHDRFKRKNPSPAGVRQKKKSEDVKYDEAFVRERIPMWIGGVGYLALGTVAVIMIPLIFHEIRWYWVIIAYLFAPSLAFCNAYGSGLTDINMAYNYGKVGLFMMAALAGKEHGVIAGLAGCGLIKSVVNISCILMQDFKTGHLTLTSPKTMFLSQAIGTALGCVIGPLCFFLFYNAFDIGNPNGEFKAPYALIYRNMAILSVQGFSALPQHCLQLCYGFFAFAVAINLVKDLSPEKIGKWMPLPMAMAVPFLIGGYFGIDMCIGSLVVFVWHKLNSKKAKVMVPAVASGLICGEGLWILPSSILALAKDGIRTFRDDDEIRRGENIESELQKGIRESRISLIVFSKDYASSRWCLDELVNILDRRKKEGHTVLPVFYTVSPEDVQNQTGSFAEAFVNHEKRGNAETGEKRKEWMEKIEKWRVALKQVAELEGMCLAKEVDGHEAKFIQKIIKEILKRLNRTVLSVPSYTVGLESRVKDINSWLQDESNEVGIGVICGLGGVGKTTVAKVAYNSNYDRFDGSCFLANVREISEKHSNGQVYLQKQIFESILKGRKEKIYNADEGIVKMKDAIGNKKVFIVFDDVDQLDVLDSLIGTRDWFYPGSKILITTRCEKLLKAHERHMLFKIKELGDDESLKLFSWYAFAQDHPLEEFKVLSTEAIQHCGGLPLALCDLGSFLSGRGMEIWRSKLQKLEAIPHSRVQKNLEISYKSLDDHDRRLFLVIASSFVGKDKDYVIKILEDCDLHPTVGIQNLIDRSLISIDDENKVMMPPLIQEMGKEIIRRESPDDPERLCKLLNQWGLSNYLTENNEIDADGDLPSAHLPEDGLVPAVGPNGAKRPYYQDFPEIAILPYLGNSLKRRFIGLLSAFPISGSLKRFFP